MHMKVNIILTLMCGLLSRRSVTAVFTTDGCNSAKGCLRLPSDCSPDSSTCLFFSWVWDTETSKFTFELSGKAGNGDTYAAVGFALEKKMKDADTYYCTGTALHSAAITMEKTSPTELDLTNEPGISVLSTSSDDGVAQCKFTRVASITKTSTTGDSAYDLTQQNYWILLAAGPVLSGNIQYHFTEREFSAMAEDITQFTAPTTMTPVPTSAQSPSADASISPHTPAKSKPVTITTEDKSTSRITNTDLTPDASMSPKASEASLTTTVPGGDQSTQPTSVFSTDTCQKSKGCFQLPSGCSPSSSSCLFFSWFWNKSTKKFEMELSGNAGNGENYVAIAFASENIMKDADLYYCTGTMLETGVIKQRHSLPTKLQLSSEPGIAVTSAATSGGIAQCKFTRVASITKETTAGDTEFDLTEQNYYILAAKGAVNNGVMRVHDSKSVSSNAVDLTDVSGNLGQRPNGNLLIASGCGLLVCAFTSIYGVAA